MSKPVKRSSWLITAALCGAAVAYLLCFFLPRMKALAVVRAELRSQREFVLNAERLRPTIERLKQDLSETKARADLWSTETVPVRHLPTLLGQINQLAAAHGGTAARFEPLAPTPFETFQKLPVTFVFTGTYQTCLELLAAIEDLPAAIWLEDVKLDKVPELRQELRCELTLAIFADQKKNND